MQNTSAAAFSRFHLPVTEIKNKAKSTGNECVTKTNTGMLRKASMEAK